MPASAPFSFPRALCLAALLSLPACGDGGGDRTEPVPEGARGALESDELADEQPAALINLALAAAGADLELERSVAVHRIEYGSVDADGAPTRLSALVAFPIGASEPLPLLSYQHGTQLLRDAAPSVVTPGAGFAVANREAFIGVVFAARGYAVVVPDYLGLGVSEVFHPYLHAETEASAVIDALRATRELAAAEGIELAPELFLVGYSQGGHATMAAHRALERDCADEFTVTAAAPMAGPYDLSGVTAESVLAGTAQPHPFQLAYLLMAYQRLYHLAPSDAELFAPAVADALPALFDGETPREPIDLAMVPVGEAPPKSPADSVAPALLAGMAETDHPLRQALRANDVYDFSPRAPVRLYHCSGDQDVTIANSQVALASLTANGATVDLVEPAAAIGGDHGTCTVPSLLEAGTWFEGLR